MPFDPTLPAASSQISSAELRSQLNGLKSLIDVLPTSGDVDDEIKSLTPAPVDTVVTLTQTISNPPTQAQVTAIQNKLNELITALKRPPLP
jgi:hypothetical protein